MICKDSLRNHKAANYQDVMQGLSTLYKAMGCNLSLKIHFLESQLVLSQKISAKPVTNGERFHQNILAMEKRHQGKWTASMLADYCWKLKRDVPDAKYRRKAYSSTF